MSYSLCWSGRFWTVQVPIGVTHAWAYVFAYVTGGGSTSGGSTSGDSTGGSVAAGMRAAIAAAYPGVGWTASSSPKECGRPFSSVVFGPEIGAELGTSSRGCSSYGHNRSQMRTHPASLRSNMSAVSGTSEFHKQSPQSATSTSLQGRGPIAEEAGRASRTRESMPFANGHMGGWMGTVPTTRPRDVGVRHA